MLQFIMQRVLPGYGWNSKMLHAKSGKTSLHFHVAENFIQGIGIRETKTHLVGIFALVLY
jgi:hypothetical protein